MMRQIGMDPTTLYPHVLERPPAIFGNAPVGDPAAAPVPDDGTVVQCDPNGKFVSEELEDLADALSDIYDQLKLSRWWWILEMIPQREHYQRDEDDLWAKELKYVMSSCSALVTR